MTYKHSVETVNGNTAAAYIAYALSDVAAIYPITPSSDMAETCDAWAAHGRKNIFGQVLRISTMQSEAGAAGAVHGALVTGALTTTFTASQGLLLMIPNMFKISGEQLPTVFHVSARVISAHALSIFSGHSDVMAARQTGFAMISSASVQEILDLGLVSHLSTLRSRVPFLHFFDGFRTSHEIQKVELIDYEEIKKMVDWEAIAAFRRRALSPERPHQRGTAQNPDIFFQNREALNRYYRAVPGIVAEEMDRLHGVTGRRYHLFDYVGAPDAERVIVCMGSAGDTVEETVNYLRGTGEKVGLIKVRLFRPFSTEHFLAAVPPTCRRLAVLEKTKEPGAPGEPLYQDICTAYMQKRQTPIIVGGRYGLGSKEFSPSMVKAAFDNLKADEPKNSFTVGITDDVTFTSLPVTEIIDTAPEGVFQGKFYGIGGDGTVGANQNSIKIIGDSTNLYAQGYFVYDSKKSGGVTISHLRFGPTPIQAPYLIDQANFIACHNPTYVTRFNILKGIRDGGTFLLNSHWSQEEMDERLPAGMKQTIARKNLKFYNLDAFKIAGEIGLGSRINVIMQAAFFYLAKVIDPELAFEEIKKSIRATYGSKGDKVVNMNVAAISKAIEALEKIQYPDKWSETTTGAKFIPEEAPQYVRETIYPMLRLEGDDLPVSAFNPDGTVPTGTTRYEKRGVAVNVPVWDPEHCTQCNQCAFICPHAAIRPYLLTDDDRTRAPESFVTKDAIGKGLKGMYYRMQVSPLDCTGCANCVDVCPAKKGTPLTMVPFDQGFAAEEANFRFAISLPEPDVEIAPDTVRGSQFKRPLFEYSGACPGCGETPYVKLVTQLFGNRMLVANATGCSSIYGGNAPTVPYCTDDRGRGPAWASSLFEDNAEYGYGYLLGVEQQRKLLIETVKRALTLEIPAELKETLIHWLEVKNAGDASLKAADRIREILPSALETAAGEAKTALAQIKEKEDLLAKRSIWIIGGDGWAYDIGYGGVDHVLSTGADVNILVLDTEVYSNTGGQSSKSTPTGAIARFAAAGKETPKKDMGQMAMTYGYAYVAAVAMGANQRQTLRAFLEAESYPGPSLIIAYSPCINHGIDMSKSQREKKLAVDSGYWILYRYNPLLAKEGKNPLVLDSKDPTVDLRTFLMNEVRYRALASQFPEQAERLFARAEQDAKARLNRYKQLAAMKME